MSTQWLAVVGFVLLFQWWCIHHVRADFVPTTVFELGEVRVGEETTVCQFEPTSTQEHAVIGQLTCDEAGVGTLETREAADKVVSVRVGRNVVTSSWHDTLSFPVVAGAQSFEVLYTSELAEGAALEFLVKVTKRKTLSDVVGIPLGDEVWQATTSGWLRMEGCESEARYFWKDVVDGRPCWVSVGELYTFPTFAPRQPLAGELVISEVMWAGMMGNTLNMADDEWIELANTTSERLDLARLHIVGAGRSGSDVVLPSAVTIGPRGFLLIGRRGAGTIFLGRPPDIADATISLSNTVGGLVLVRGDGHELDRMPSGMWPAGCNDVAGRVRASAQRLRLDGPGTDGANWGHCAPTESVRCAALYGQQDLKESNHNWATPWQRSLL